MGDILDSLRAVCSPQFSAFAAHVSFCQYPPCSLDMHLHSALLWVHLFPTLDQVFKQLDVNSDQDVKKYMTHIFGRCCRQHLCTLAAS